MTKEIEGIVWALDRILTAYRVELDRQERAKEVTPEMPEIDWSHPKVTRAQIVAHALVEDPVGRAMTLAIESLGRRLYEAGGMKAMHDAIMAVGAMNPEQESWREGILDRRWSGIGSWLA